MIPEGLLPLTVTWQQPGQGSDDYGDTIPDWAGPTETVLRAMVEQRTATEPPGDGRDATVTGLVMFTNELGVSADDRIVWDGTTYEVDGDPWVVQSPAGPHHIEAQLKLVEG